MAEKDDASLKLAATISAATAVAVGIVHNYGYFAVVDVNLMALLDYADFLYTPFLLFLPAVGSALFVLALRGLWEKANHVTSSDVFLSVAFVVVALAINLAGRAELTGLLGAYAPLLFNATLLGAMGVTLLWIWRNGLLLQENGVGFVAAAFGFLLVVALYAAQQARYELAGADFPDALVLKEQKIVGDLRLLRIVSNGVFLIAKDQPGLVQFYKSDAYEALRRRPR